MKFKDRLRRKVKKKKKFSFKDILDRIQKFDKLVLILVFALFVLGLLMIYSITSISIYNGVENDTLYFVKKILFSLILGIAGMLFLALIPYKWLKYFGFLSLIGCPSILLVTLLFGEGTEASDVRSWFRFGGLSVQPAEFVKAGIILALAYLISTMVKFKKYYMTSLKSIGRGAESVHEYFKNTIRYISNGYLIVLIYLGFCTLLILLQPDLGSALIIFGIGIIIFICSGISFKVIGGLGILGLFLLIPLLLGLKGYQMDRFSIWLDPFNHEKGLQNVMGYTAIALGGLFGVGIGNSTQKYGYIIEPHTDFIVTILAEELGVFTVMLIMIAYATISLRCFFTAFKCKDLFGSLVCIGVGALFLIQPIVNLGGASGTIPLTGVTLPFISYGGTSSVALFLVIGIYLNVRIEMLSRLNAETDKKEKQIAQANNIVPFKNKAVK